MLVISSSSQQFTGDLEPQLMVQEAATEMGSEL
jgi:hypothetical protein